MSLIIILLALLVERLAAFIHPIRNHHWLEHYTQKVTLMVGKRAYVSLPLTVVPILAVVFVVHFLLLKVSFGWAAWLYDLVVLVYCLGNTHLRLRAQECYEQVTLGNVESARSMLLEYFDVEEAGEITPFVLMHAFYRAALQRIFAILFWFIILGPVGAVLYRVLHKLSVYVSEEGAMGQVKSLSNQATFLMDWIPARLLALSFCLAGNFMDVFTEWRSTFKASIKETYPVLYRCGHVAIRADETLEPAAVYAQFDEAYHLVCRSLFIWLVALALIILF